MGIALFAVMDQTSRIVVWSEPDTQQLAEPVRKVTSEVGENDVGAGPLDCDQ